MRKLTLIMPGVGRKPGRRYVSSWTMEPLGLAVLAGVTPADIEIRFVDDRLEVIPYDEPTEAVGINVETYTARRAYAIAARFRSRGVPVILGGYHPTLIPDEASAHADAIVEGEAETLWPQVIEDVRSHHLQRRYASPTRIATPGGGPRREIFAGRKYLPMTLIETGRGCRFACDFCSVSPFYRRTSAPKAIEHVLAEIEDGGRRNVFFVDDNIIADLDRAKQLFAALEPARIGWFSQGSINMADDRDLLAAMSRSGCRGILIGFESLSATSLAAMGKSWAQISRDYSDSIRRIHNAGIPIYATFVFGYDTDDADAINRTVAFAIEQRFSMAAFNHLVPFPGTPLYERLQRERRLISDPWWLNPDYRFGDVAFHPRCMSAEELAQRCFDARTAFYRFGSILHRATNVRSNCHDLRSAATYFWLNAFSGKQMRARQGLPLGSGFDDESLPLEREPTGAPLPQGAGA